MPSASYTTVAKGLHWIAAACVLGLLALGLWMTGLPISRLKMLAFAWHKWIGLLVLALTVLRLVWRWRHPPPPLPASIARWERRAAPIVQGTLLILLLALPASGWLMNSAGGVEITWFELVPVPDLVGPDRALFALLRTAHHWLAWCLMAALALHVSAVVRHDLVRRDGILRRMLPFAN